MKLRDIKAMNKKLRSQEPSVLRDELLQQRRAQFNLRMARATGTPPKPDHWQSVRRSIARLKTIQGEKATQGEKAGTQVKTGTTAKR